MANKQHICDSCLRLCDEAKQAVVVLQKRNYILTIVCTVAITLLGEQGAKILLSTIDTTTSALKAAEIDVSEKHSEENGKENHVIDTKPKWVVPQSSFSLNSENTESIKPYELVDELSVIPSITEQSKEYLSKDTIQKIVKTATKNIINQPKLENIKNNVPNTVDNNSVFFTPSYMPFDVYSTTLGLGLNYGFGEYYGIDTGFVVVPNTATIGILGTSFILFRNKRRG